MATEPINDLLNSAVDPESLASFIEDLESLGFAQAQRREHLAWVGPTPRCLIVDGHTSATECALSFRPGWPYLPPLLEVDGIATWHANQDALCLWREGDASRQWATVAGFLERVDAWSESARDGFGGDPETLNALVYWNGPRSGRVGLIDLTDLAVRSEAAGGDGHRGRLFFRPEYGGPEPTDLVLSLTPLTLRKRDFPEGFGTPESLRGRYFYRGAGQIADPPTTVAGWEAALTAEQAEQYRRDCSNQRYERLVHVLLWETGGGPAALALEHVRDALRKWSPAAIDLRPDGQRALLLRAGPDAQSLRDRHVVVIGVGAIGGYVADLLARSGAGRLTLVDPDVLWPANTTRHVLGRGVIGAKADILAHVIRSSYPWVQVTSDVRHLWHPREVGQIVDGSDLVIDATADLGHVELTSRVCADLAVPFVSSSLHRAGAVVRVTRQADGDIPIWQRTHLDRYPDIPPLPDELEYAGLETGCLAPVHNAPPVAVVRAAALTAQVAIDFLAGNCHEPDEIIEVLRASGGWLDDVGRVEPHQLPMNVMLTESARATMLAAAEAAGRNETGGLLAGPLDGDRPVITQATVIPPTTPSPTSYIPPLDAIADSLDELRTDDQRIGYLGLWHSHAGGAEPSTTDLRSFTSITDDPATGTPVFLIVAGSHEGRTISAHRHPEHGPVHLHRAGDIEGSR